MLFFRRRSNKQTIELTGRLHKYKLKRVDSSFIIISYLDRKIKEGVDVIMEKMSQSMDAVQETIARRQCPNDTPTTSLLNNAAHNCSHILHQHCQAVSGNHSIHCLLNLNALLSQVTTGCRAPLTMQ